MHHKPRQKNYTSVGVKKDNNNNLLPEKGRSTTLPAQLASIPTRRQPTTYHTWHHAPPWSRLLDTEPRSVRPLRNSGREGGDVTTTGNLLYPVRPPTSEPKPMSFVTPPVESTRRVYTGKGPRGGFQGNIADAWVGRGGTPDAHAKTWSAFWWFPYALIHSI